MTSGNSGTASIFEVLAKIQEMLAKVDLTITDFLEMITDSGISAQDIVDAYNYLNENPDAEAEQGTDTVSVPVQATAALQLMHLYEQTLATWLLTGGIDVHYDMWGWNNAVEK